MIYLLLKNLLSLWSSTYSSLMSFLWLFIICISFFQRFIIRLIFLISIIYPSSIHYFVLLFLIILICNLISIFFNFFRNTSFPFLLFMLILLFWILILFFRIQNILRFLNVLCFLVLLQLWFFILLNRSLNWLCLILIYFGIFIIL